MRARPAPHLLLAWADEATLAQAVATALGMSLVGHMGWVMCFHLCVSSFPEIDRADFAEHLLVVPVHGRPRRLDRQPRPPSRQGELVLPDHPNIRGPRYYH